MYTLFTGKMSGAFEGASTLEDSAILEHSQLSGIHPFMSAESITLADQHVRMCA